MSHTIRREAGYRLQRLHEHNYALLLKLVPDWTSLDKLEVSHEADGPPLYLRVLETTRYTTTISLTSYIDTAHLHLAYPEAEIRLYHDARVAEVLRYRRRTGLSWIDNQPRFRDTDPIVLEKLNRFLARWLGECIARGHIFIGGIGECADGSAALSLG